MWTSTGQLGDVQSGQQTGYLFPMGPFFAVGHAFGIPDWIVQRLWLGTSWHSPRGGSCGCSTRCSDARAESRTWSPARSSS